MRVYNVERRVYDIRSNEIRRARETLQIHYPFINAFCFLFLN